MFAAARAFRSIAMLLLLNELLSILAQTAGGAAAGEIWMPSAKLPRSELPVMVKAVTVAVLRISKLMPLLPAVVA